MLKLAECEGLSYYMLKEDNPNRHIVLVRDEKGREGKYSLESRGTLATSLLSTDQMRVRDTLREFEREFIEYWKEFVFSYK